MGPTDKVKAFNKALHFIFKLLIKVAAESK